ncbi:hypothetical protein [Paenibacillus sp. MMS18-CY102]|uniref:hypothetical protein n=1 Tax=Paenibacillus sp. MMS18-CY102 TaxID=2682849 RepID=UPI00136546D2|nr:hypothetical protein [Paenibacillus sp. MMS18-CY102]MWC28537.1 hypothetical protein [Paenibacillus sp. MMS18-CY102]
MGTWGFGVFDDDFTLDIKDYYLLFKEEGVSVNQAVSRIKRIYSDIMNDEGLSPDLEPLFYIGLAATQQECNELVEEIKNKAIEHITLGTGLERWRNAGLISHLRRKSELKKLKKQLMKSECITDSSIVDEVDLNSGRFDPSNQRYSVYEITFPTGKKLIGNTVHLERRGKHFEKYPLK